MRTILITGGSTGLGYAIAKLLSKTDNVYILSRSKEPLIRVSKELNCNYKVCDVTNWESIKQAVAEITQETSKLDVLINNAGLWIQGPLEDNDPSKIKNVIDVNTLGPILMTKAVVPIMRKQNAGTILNVISQSGLYGKEERSVYHASKWALTGFTKSLYMELTKHNIKVMGFYPGGMATDFFDKAGYVKDKSKMLEVHDVAKTIEFMLNQSEFTMFPELGMQSIKQ